ncbi:hypothetical protein [uncultured Shimia sp.]|uniref:hypothetical protein n=1 Tax=uncultured Shimia sp. TaxID=573152 RepID=UPI0025D9C130|nr:hypothetical protein [uncultured Shimia sp.]
MFVEIAGMPGCGKTTIFKGLSTRLTPLGVASNNINNISMHRLATDWLPRFVKGKPQRELLYRFSRFVSAHPKLVSYAERIYDKDDVKQFLFVLMCANYQASVDLAEDGEVIFLEEGFLTHSVAASLPLAQSKRALHGLVSKLPIVDAVVFIKTPPQVAFERVFQRRGLRLGNKKLTDKFGGMDSFVARADLFERGVHQYCERGPKLIEIDAAWSPQEAADYAAKEIVAMVAESAAGETQVA